MRSVLPRTCVGDTDSWLHGNPMQGMEKVKCLRTETAIKYVLSQAVHTLFIERAEGFVLL